MALNCDDQTAAIFFTTSSKLKTPQKRNGVTIRCWCCYGCGRTRLPRCFVCRCPGHFAPDCHPETGKWHLRRTSDAPHINKTWCHHGCCNQKQSSPSSGSMGNGDDVGFVFISVSTGAVTSSKNSTAHQCKTNTELQETH